MSLTGKRDEIATALSAVVDMSGFSFRPSTPNVGDAWPVLGPLDRGPGTAFMVTWLVRVFMPQDEQQASAWWDAHWPALFEALERVASVQRAIPVALAAEGGTQLAFEITMNAEE